MSSSTNIEVGELTVVSCTSAGPPFMKCRKVVYGVVIGFTKKGNPRVIPLCYKQNQNFMKFTDPMLSLLRGSCVIPDALAVDRDQIFRRGGEYARNYNYILNTIQNGKSKNKSVPIRTQKKVDFSF